MKEAEAWAKDCPFVSRKCKANNCAGWEKTDEKEGFCIIIKGYKNKEIKDATI